MTTYTTRTEAIQREIVEPIENGAAARDEYDIDAIAGEVLGGYAEGFALMVDVEEFWAVVQKYVR